MHCSLGAAVVLSLSPCRSDSQALLKLSSRLQRLGGLVEALGCFKALRAGDWKALLRNYVRPCARSDSEALWPCGLAARSIGESEAWLRFRPWLAALILRCSETLLKL